MKIGMTAGEIEALLGKASHSQETTSQILLFYGKRIYGKNAEIDLEINGLYMFSPVLVVLEQGRVTRVYSRGWISRSWIPDALDYGLQTLVAIRRGSFAPVCSGAPTILSTQ